MKNSNHFIVRLMILLSLVLIISTDAYPFHNTVTMKNGSVFNGDVVVQRIGNDITVDAETATIIIHPEDIVARNQRKVKYEDLPRELKRWVLENKALSGDAYGRYVILEDIKTKKYTYIGLVNKITDGKATETYVQVTPTTYNIKWKDVQEISRNNSNQVKYDLVDEVVTAKGQSHRGKVTSQMPGNGVTVETSKGIVRIANKDIRELRKHKLKDSGSYFNQVDYINKVRLKDGEEKEGLITINHYGANEKDNYIGLQKRSGEKENILISKIAEIQTQYNSNEQQVYLPNKVYLNEFKIEKALFTKQGDNVVFVDKKVYPFPEGIEISFKSDGTKFIGNWQLVSLSEIGFENENTSWGYKISQKEGETVPVKTKDTQSTISSVTYGYLSPGYYALVNDTDSECYVFKITK